MLQDSTSKAARKARKLETTSGYSLVQSDASACASVEAARATFARHVEAVTRAAEDICDGATILRSNGEFVPSNLLGVAQQDEILTLKEAIEHFLQQRRHIAAMFATLRVGVFEMDVSELRQALLPSPLNCLAQIYRSLL